MQIICNGEYTEACRLYGESAPTSTYDTIASPSPAAVGEAGGLGSAGTRVIPFHSLPTSGQEELGVELFDDPLLTPEK